MLFRMFGTAKIITISIASAIIIVVFVPRTLAQDIISAKAEAELDKTEIIIETARSVVDDSHSQKGRIKLEKAIQIQSRARKAFITERAYRNTVKLTLIAREEAREAIAIARHEAKITASLFRIMEETTERIAMVREMMRETDINVYRIRKILDDAQNLLEKSRLNFHQYRYQLAMNLAESAKKHTNMAERQVRKARTLKETTLHRITQLEQLIDRVTEKLNGEDSQSLIRLRNTENQLNNAKQLIKEGRYRAAGMTVNKCEKTFRSLIRDIPTGSSYHPDRLIEEIRKLLNRADGIKSQINAAKYNARVATALEKAIHNLRSAEDQIEQGKIDRARTLTSRARNIILRIESNLDKKTGEANARSSIEIAESKLVRVRDIIRTCSAPDINKMLERAERHIEGAKNSLDEGNEGKACVKADMAINILDRIRDVCASR